MQYKVMDFNKRSSLGRRHVYDRDWDTAMTPQQKAAAKFIGWTRKIWNEGEWLKVKLHLTPWHKLTRPQLNAATTLDFGEDSWDLKAAELQSERGTSSDDLEYDDTEDEDNDDGKWNEMKQRAIDISKKNAKGMASAAVYGDSSPTTGKDKTDDPYDDPTHTSTDEDNACVEPEGVDPDGKNAMTLPSNSLNAPPLGAFKAEIAKAAVIVHDKGVVPLR